MYYVWAIVALCCAIMVIVVMRLAGVFSGHYTCTTNDIHAVTVYVNGHLVRCAKP